MRSKSGLNGSAVWGRLRPPWGTCEISINQSVLSIWGVHIGGFYPDIITFITLIIIKVTFCFCFSAMIKDGRVGYMVYSLCASHV